MFIGREDESNIIARAVKSARPELGIVYGRRRIGKSTLLAESIHKGDLYFEGLQKASRKQQIDHFVSQLAEQTKSLKVAASDWRTAFEALTHHVTRGRRYVVLDEFPWMASERTELVSLVKYFWDNHWKGNPKLTLVLCGSIANFMVKHLVHSQALHNRKTFEIRLESLPAHEARAFFRDFRSDFEIARFLMVFGGVPKYLEQIDPANSLSVNMDQLCFRKNAFFLTEFESIFKEQFRVTRTYENIVRALSKQSYSKQALARKLKMKPGGGLTGYLRNLEETAFVQTFQALPIGGRGGKTQRSVLWDEWLRFYLAYVEPHRKTIQLSRKPGLFDRLCGKSFDTWCGLSFEQLCMKNLPSIMTSLGIGLDQLIDFGPFFRQPRRGAKRNDGLQIDLLLHRTGQTLTLIECKFRTRPVGVSVIEEVKRKIKLLKVPRGWTVERVLLCAGEITRDLQQSGYFHRILGLESIFAPPA